MAFKNFHSSSIFGHTDGEARSPNAFWSILKVKRFSYEIEVSSSQVNSNNDHALLETHWLTADCKAKAKNLGFTALRSGPRSGQKFGLKAINAKSNAEA